MNAEQQQQVAEKLARPAVPFTPPSYEEVLGIAANAIANEFAKMQNKQHRHTRNMIDLMDDASRAMCLAMGKAVIDAVSEHGRKAAEAANRSVPVEVALAEIVCENCGAKHICIEVESITDIACVTFNCGGEVLVPKNGEMRTRRVCPVKTETDGKN